MSEGALPARAVIGIGARLLVRPQLWLTAARQAGVLTTPAWRRFRMETQYGAVDHDPDGGDVMAWLAWCRSWRRAVPLPGGPSLLGRLGNAAARRRVQG
jgi:hypothetical protein